MVSTHRVGVQFPPEVPFITVRYQEKPYSCGPSALLNACRVLGKKVSERKLRPLAECSEENGTNEVGLISAARNLGYTATTHSSADQKAAWAFVRSNILDGKPVLLCIDNWGHWVTAVGIIGDQILVIDPANTKKNSDENGIHPMNRRALFKRWKCPSESEPLYAIAIGK